MTDGRPPTVLTIVSADHGELSLAMNFLAGLPFGEPVLIPAHLYRLNATHGLPPARRYASHQDLHDAVDHLRPDAVLLFSGYLFAINGLLAIDEVAAFVRRLADEGVVAATTDPFLGLQAKGGPIFSDRHPRRAWLEDHFARLSDVLAGLIHLYPVDPGQVPGRRTAWWFNGSDPPPVRKADPPTWVVVLSAEDDGLLASLHGRDRLTGLLADRLRDAERAGRKPIFVAPPGCVEAVRSASAPGMLLPFCPRAEFLAHLMAAEHAFYGNVLANSISTRLSNGLPVHFFDRGHLARAVPPLYEAGVRAYFSGAVPDILDLDSPWLLDNLAARAAAQKTAPVPAVLRYRAGPSPSELLIDLLGEPS